MNWISVHDELPGDLRDVLVLNDGGICSAYLSDRLWKPYAYGFNTKYITHWMELPEPPEDNYDNH